MITKARYGTMRFLFSWSLILNQVSDSKSLMPSMELYTSLDFNVTEIHRYKPNCQYVTGYSLTTDRRQAIISTTADWDIRHHMTPTGRNKLIALCLGMHFYFKAIRYNWCDMTCCLINAEASGIHGQQNEVQRSNITCLKLYIYVLIR